MKFYRTPKSINITVIYALESKRNYLIFRTTKASSSVVIMNRSDYIKEVERQLENVKYYEHLSEDPSEILQKYKKDTVENIAQKERKTEINNLVTSGARTSQFYVLPKIHQEHNGTVILVILVVLSYLPVTLAQKIVQDLLMNFLQPHVKNLNSYV